MKKIILLVSIVTSLFSIEKNGFFVGLSTSSSNTLSSVIGTSTNYNQSTQKNSVFLGEYLQNDFFYLIEYSNVDYSKYSIETASLEVNYAFFDSNYTPYIGFIYGYSIFEWNQSPDDNLEKNKGYTGSSIYGITLGVSVKIFDSFFIQRFLNHILLQNTNLKVQG